MKLSLNVQQTDGVLRAIAALRSHLEKEQLSVCRFDLSDDFVSAFDGGGNEIGMLHVSGGSAGNGWVQSKQHGSQSIRVDLAA